MLQSCAISTRTAHLEEIADGATKTTAYTDAFLSTDTLESNSCKGAHPIYEYYHLTKTKANLSGQQSPWGDKTVPYDIV